MITRLAVTLTGHGLTFRAVLAFTLMYAVSAVSPFRTFFFALGTEPAAMTGTVATDRIAFAVLTLTFRQTARAVISDVARFIAKLTLTPRFAKTSPRNGIAPSQFAFARF